MNNSCALDFFNELAVSKENNKYSVKLAKNSDYTNIDAQFISKYVTENSKMLDLGSGSGLIINKLYKNIEYIECIEKFYAITAIK